jgi:hypothetical protein
MHVRYTARRKRGLVAASKHLQVEGRSIRDAAAELGVSIPNLSKWVLQGIGKINHLDKILRSKKKAALTGPVSQLKVIEDALLHYIFELREQGTKLQVSEFPLKTWVTCVSTPLYRAACLTMWQGTKPIWQRSIPSVT